MSKIQGTAIFLVAASVTAVFFIDFCNWIYACGCRSLWAGADAHCNIHQPGARHCPFCAIGVAGGGAVFLAIVAPQAYLSFRPARWAWPFRLLAALAAFPVAGSGIAILLGWRMGYWN
jgi:hypothetical protein